MIKIWYPVKKSEDTNINAYMIGCYMQLLAFKNILRSNINVSKWKALEPKLINNNLVRINKTTKLNILNIPNTYVNCLKCFFDPNLQRCYYAVSEFTKCPYSESISLNFIIKLVEYGNESIPPLNWIRHSYSKFVDVIEEGKK